jgi:endonuclease-3
VNEITPALFAAAPTPEAMAALPLEVLQAHIRQIGLAPSKAKYLSGLSAQLVARHGGRVPSTFAELEALPGVGHKTASVVMAQAFGASAFPVDTHIWRLSMRWGLSAQGANVVQVERDLKSLFEEQTWATLHLQMIFFGRQYCVAQRHNAGACPICSWAAAAVEAEAAAAVEAEAAAAVKAEEDEAAGEGGVLATPKKAARGTQGGAGVGSASKRLPSTPRLVTPAKRGRKAEEPPSSS